MSAQMVPGFRTASTGSPADRSPDVVDIKSARQARNPQMASWFCATCDLVAEGFTPTECAYLATVHDQVQHGSRQTAMVMLGSASPVPPTTDLDTGLGIGA
jgi:hypothetical protein